MSGVAGYYYDEAKNRYFKIEPGHQAVPSAVTQQEVDTQNAQQEEATELEHWMHRLMTERVQRARALRMPLQLLRREITSKPLTSAYQMEIRAITHASQLKNSWSMHTLPELNLEPPIYDCVDIKSVLRDTRNGTIFVAESFEQESTIMLTSPEITNSGQWSYNTEKENRLFQVPYDISSMSLSHTGHLLSTLNSGPQGDCFLYLHKIPEEIDHSFSGASTDPYRVEGQRKFSYWASAAQPTGQTPRFAIGTSDGLQVMEGTPDGWELEEKTFYDRHAPGIGRREAKVSVNAVEWMSNHVIAAGMRSKAVAFHDLRSYSGTGAFKLRHDQPVTQVKKVEDYHVVVAGPFSLKMYDMRWVPDDGMATRPYLTFSPFIGREIPTFDLSPELGLLLAPTQKDDGENDSIETYSLQDGGRIGGPITFKRYWGSSPQSVTFDTGNDLPGWRGPRAPSVLFGADQMVEEWTY